MRRWTGAALLLAAASPAGANFVPEISFAQKLAMSDLVVIGTVTAIDRGGNGREGASATLRVLSTLKGEPPETVTVSTYSRIAESDPRCCDPGATYLMFLRRSPNDGMLTSVWGASGMIRIGGRGDPVEIFPSSLSRQ